MQRNLLIILTLSITLASSFLSVAQGPLVPPGAPGASMKSLDQIYGEIAKLTPANPLVLPPVLDPKTQATIHMTVKGQIQGDFDGESTLKGYEKSIACIGFSHEIISPRDPATGLPTGKRQHKPIVIVKYIDKTTPLFFNALTRNENLGEVTLKFFRTEPSGGASNYFNIKLINANVSHVSHAAPNTETLEFTYRTIEWTHVASGITASDDWEQPIN